MRLLFILFLCLTAHVALGQPGTISDPSTFKHGVTVSNPSITVDQIQTFSTTVNGSLANNTELASSSLGSFISSWTFQDSGSQYSTATASKGYNGITWAGLTTNLVVGSSIETGSGLWLIKDANVDNTESVLGTLPGGNTDTLALYGEAICLLTAANNQSTSPVSLDVATLATTGGTGNATWEQISPTTATGCGYDFEANDSGRTYFNSSTGINPSLTTNVVYFMEAIVDYTHKTQTNLIFDTTTVPWNQIGPEVTFTNGVGTGTGFISCDILGFDPGITWNSSSKFAVKDFFIQKGANVNGFIEGQLGLYHPINITATAASYTSITLTWTSNPHASSYNIDQSSDGGSTWSRIQTSYGTTSLTINSLTSNQAYLFRVASNVGANTSNTGLSNSATPHTVDWLGYWLFDNPGSGVATDLTTHGNNGTINNSPTQVTGVNGIGHATLLTASSAQYCNLNNPALFQLTGSFTINLWVNFTTYPSVTAYTFFSKNNGVGNGYVLFQNIGVSGSFIGAINPLTDAISQGSPTFSTGIWYMVTMTYDVSTKNCLVWVNGSVSGSATGSASGVSDAGNLIVGQSPANWGFGTGLFFDGAVEGFGIVNRAMTSAEVLANYNSGNVVTP